MCKTPTPEPWERQPKEGQEAFAAFCRYRDMGPDDRSIRKAEQDNIKTVSKCLAWSQKHSWVNRCKAWDSHLDEVKRKATEKAVADMGKRHIELAMAMQGLAAKGLKRFQEMDFVGLDADEIRQLIVAGANLERLSRGEVTARTEITGNPLEALVNLLGTRES